MCLLLNTPENYKKKTLKHKTTPVNSISINILTQKHHYAALDHPHLTSSDI